MEHSRSDGKPTTASFVIHDSLGRVYPSQVKRLAPDFAFHPQVYRADGESVLLPQGNYSIECARGPEYRKRTQKIEVKDRPQEVRFELERWIDPAKMGWYSGDHHIHAAGCAHYEKPSEGVYPQDMMRHILGEDLNVGEVLSWGPGWYFQKTFFEGKPNRLSTSSNVRGDWFIPIIRVAFSDSAIVYPAALSVGSHHADWFADFIPTLTGYFQRPDTSRAEFDTRPMRRPAERSAARVSATSS